MTPRMTFSEMLKTVRAGLELNQRDFAKAISISPQYLHDLEHRRRLPSVEITNRICAYMGRGPKGRLEWHQAAAREHGFEV